VKIIARTQNPLSSQAELTQILSGDMSGEIHHLSLHST